MKYKKYDYKVAYLDFLIRSYEGAPIHMLDMGSGTSKDFVEVLQQHPGVSYTGIEMNPASLAKAKELLAHCGNVTFLNDFGEKLTQHYEDYFDLTLSLSVLEHVKYIEEFLATSVRVTKPGGRIIHRYDLGHSLHSDMREKAKVFLCNNVPWLMPARHFTCHPSSKHLVECLEAAGVGNLEVSYSQLPDLKAMMNRLRWDGDAATTLSKGIIDLDRDLAASMERVLPDKEMEFFFPTITIVGRKNSRQLRRG